MTNPLAETSDHVLGPVFTTREQVIRFMQTHPGDDARALRDLRWHVPSGVNGRSWGMEEQFMDALIDWRDEHCDCDRPPPPPFEEVEAATVQWSRRWNEAVAAERGVLPSVHVAADGSVTIP